MNKRFISLSTNTLIKNSLTTKEWELNLIKSNKNE